MRGVRHTKSKKIGWKYLFDIGGGKPKQIPVSSKLGAISQPV